MNRWLYSEEESLSSGIGIVVNDSSSIVEFVYITMVLFVVIDVNESLTINENIESTFSVLLPNVTDSANQSEGIIITTVLFVAIDVNDADSVGESVLCILTLTIDVNDTNSSTEFAYLTFVPSVVINRSDSITKSESITIRSSGTVYIEVNDTDSVIDVVDGIWSSFVLSWNDIETYLSTLPLSWSVISDAIEGTRAAILDLSWRVMDVLSSLLMSWRVIPIQITGLNTNIQLPVFFVSFNTLQINIGDNISISESIVINGLTEIVNVNEPSVEIDVVVISITRIINVIDTQLLTEFVSLKQSLAVGDILIFTEIVNVSII